MKISLSTSLLTIIAAVAISVSPALGWNAASPTGENISVFDSNFQLISSYTKENWTTAISSPTGVVTHQVWSGSPPVLMNTLSDDNLALQNNRIAVPNQLSGSSVPDSSSYHPAVSWCSFDKPLFESPGDAKPGLTASPASGNFDGTVGITLQAYASDPNPMETYRELTIEREFPLNSGQWQNLNGPKVQLFFDTTTTVRVRAKLTIQYPEQVPSITFSEVGEYIYTINHPADWNRDSDGDGYPDTWEIAHGFNPLSAEDPDYGADTDDDGYRDLYEILRGSDPHDSAIVPNMKDSDNDGYPDWDEDLRNTNKNDATEHPVNTRLYEVEEILSGTVRNNISPQSNGFLSIHTLTGETVAKIDRVKIGADGSYGPLRIPVGSYAVLNAGINEEHSKNSKRFIPAHPDLHPAMMTDTGWQTAAEWQDLYEQFLKDNLVVTVTGFDVAPLDAAPLGLLVRALEIFHNGRVESGTPEIWYSPGRYGHNPEATLVNEFDKVLADTALPAWAAQDTAAGRRNINTLMEDFVTILVQKNCRDISGDVQRLYDDATIVTTLDEAIAEYMQMVGPSYLASLLSLYSLDSLRANPTVGEYSCAIFSDDYDLDGDGLSNDQEISHFFAGDSLSSIFSLQDTDGDTIADDQDNCPSTVNPDQNDFDADGIGDLCDPDLDNDGLANGLESAIGGNPYNNDTNGDGTADGDAWENNLSLGLVVYMEPAAMQSGDTQIFISGVRSRNTLVTVNVSGGATAGTISYPDESSWMCQISNIIDYGQYAVTLSATESGSSEVGFGSGTITRTPVPVAILHAPVIVIQGKDFVLDGSDSYVPDGSAPALYHWTLISGPDACDGLSPGMTVTTTESKFTLAAGNPLPRDGLYTFALAIEEQTGELSDQTRVTVEIHAPTTIYVDQAADSSNQDGSETHPFVTIQQGVDRALLGDTVLVRPGTYSGDGNKNILLTGKGITLLSSGGRDRTVIDCENDGRGITIGSGTPDRLLVDGFMIINGNYSWGAGLYIRSSNPTIRNCTFHANQTISGGGGIGMYDSAPLIENCLFTGNTANRGGGAVHVERSRPTFRNCRFSGNLSAKNPDGDFGDGGAVYGHLNSVVKIVTSSFDDNRAQHMGGAIAMDSYLLTVVNSRFTGNHADSSSGGAINVSGGAGEVFNSIINSNHANEGGGISAFKGCELTIINSTLYANQAAWGGALMVSDSEATVTNAILWNNSAGTAGQQVLLDNEGLLTVTSSDVSGGTSGIYDYSGEFTLDYQSDNIDSDPIFINPAGADGTMGTSDDNLALQQGSPCIDSAKKTALPKDTFDLDKDGDTVEPVALDMYDNFRIWPFKGAPDMGASEYAANGLSAEYSNGTKRFEGPLNNGHSHDCTATDNILYQNTCTPLADSPAEWAWGSFSVQWNGYLFAPVSGTYTISSHFWVDGDIRVKIDKTTVADLNTSGAAYNGQVTLQANHWVPVSISFASNGGSNRMILGWTVPGKNWSLIPRRYLVGSDDDIFLPENKSILWMALPAIIQGASANATP